MSEPKKCGCGQTKNAQGLCDGSHANIKTNGVGKPIPYDKITIRVISTQEPQKTKNVYASIANNKALMKRMEFVISDPLYEVKMKSVTEKKPYVETTSKTPVTA